MIFQGTGSPTVVVPVVTAVAVAVVPVVHTMVAVAVAEAMETWGWVPLEMVILIVGMGEIDAVIHTCGVVSLYQMHNASYFTNKVNLLR